MAKSLAQKILEKHIVKGKWEPDSEIAIRIDQTLTQDATGTMAYLQFEAMGVKKVKTELSVSYIDHNTLQSDFRNADDHKFLQSIAEKYGILLSRAGNGICHQLHLERFARPGRTLLGSDSHTPTAGGVGSIAIGAGGLDVAVAMGGGEFYVKVPKIVGVKLTGKLPNCVAAKDVILEVLRKLGVKGAVGKILEYYGPGILTLTVPERGTITNMGTETGATTSIFPSDNITKKFLTAQGRAKDWQALSADSGVKYDETIEINLSKLEPLIAKPHSPGNVVKVSQVAGTPVQQVCIGSCTNSSLKDLKTVAAMLKGKTVHPDVSLTISPGSKQVLNELAETGELSHIIASGARVLECACGPCIGMGQAPQTNAVTIRTFNRNFEGRCGTKSAKAYLCSPETAVACALTGKITDPRKLGKCPDVKLPAKFTIDDRMIIKPPKSNSNIKIIRGPNIKPLPKMNPLPAVLTGKVLLKVGDDITTDHIMPAGAKLLPLRSNLPAISDYVFEQVDPEFVNRAKKNKGGFIIGGENYGQGSSREHAALAPMYLGVKAVIAKSFARIHKDNLINFGIIPLEFADKSDYNKIKQGGKIEILGIKAHMKNCSAEFTIKYNGGPIKVRHSLTKRFMQILLAGGKLNYTRQTA
ncbi:MAG: aconitate hydratase [archaeon]